MAGEWSDCLIANPIESLACLCGRCESSIHVCEVQGKRVEESLAAANFKVEELQDSLTKTDGKVEQLAHEIKSQRMEDKPG